jgi:hypothetical protein
VTLRDVGSTLERLGSATLTQLAAELSASPRDVEVLLEFWERRGNVRRCSMIATSACGTTCTRCPLGKPSSKPARRAEQPVGRVDASVYEWVTNERND